MQRAEINGTTLEYESAAQANQSYSSTARSWGTRNRPLMVEPR